MFSHLPPPAHAVNYTQNPQSWLPSASTLVQGCINHLHQPIPSTWHQAFADMGIPPLDLEVTVMSARIGLLALQRGLGFFHHELRGRIPMPESLHPEHRVWDGGTTPEWEQGVLTEPKYFSFFLDTPLSPYNPNYRQKWRSHELLHGVVGFFWHPQMTRFEAYLGARLDELLPIVHWYGLDEMFRPRCPQHRGQPMYRELCVTCESMARPYCTHTSAWIDQETELAHTWVHRAWQHFSQEWHACLHELQTGERSEIPHPYLNASSDAVGYLYSHWPRLTAWSFGSWVERFLQQGVDYFHHIPAFMEHIALTAQRMVCGHLGFDPHITQRLRIRRMLQDLGYRTFVALEWLEEGSRVAHRAESILLPLLDEAAHLCHQLLCQDTTFAPANTLSAASTETTTSTDSANALVHQAYELFHHIAETFYTQIHSRNLLPPQVSEPFLLLGYPWPLRTENASIPSTSNSLCFSQQPDSTKTSYDPPSSASLSASQHAIWSGMETFLRAGLDSTSSQAWELLSQQDTTPPLQKFAASSMFYEAGRLLSRYSRWYGCQTNHDPFLAEYLRFEAWLQDEPHRDEEAECFAVLPEHPSVLLSHPGRLRIHRTFRRHTWSARLIQEILETSLPTDHEEIAAIHHEDQQRLLLLDHDMKEILENIGQESPGVTWLTESLHEPLQILLEHAVILWFPVPRQPPQDHPP